MNKTGLNIRRANINDAETLAPLAVQIFNDTFAGHPLNKPEDMRAYIAEALSVEQIRSEITDTARIVFVVEFDGEMIGFAQLREHSTEDCVSDLNPIEIQRLYLKQEFHGRGIANQLMKACLDEAVGKNYRTIWLGVWEHNHRAQRFYEKVGFVKVGEHVFLLGNDPQTDWVMEKKL